MTTTDPAACALPDVTGDIAGTASTAPQLVTPALAAAAVAGGALLVDVRSQGNRDLTGGLPTTPGSDDTEQG